MTRPGLRFPRVALAAALAWCACGDAPPADAPVEIAREGPPHADWRLVEDLREDTARERHPSDGGGRAWLEQGEGDPAHAVAHQPGRFTLVYEVGPLGVAQGGSISLQISPFWGWSTPQVEEPRAPGYTRVEPSTDDIELEATTLDEQLLGLRVTGRALVEGDRVRLVYGDGEIGAVADDFAERNSRFWFAVDGDGDGVRKFLEDSPGIDVWPGEAARLVVTVPSIARPGESFPVTVAVLDALGNAGVPFEGEVTFLQAHEGLELPERVSLEPDDRGHKTVTAVARQTGVIRLLAELTPTIYAESNPLTVSSDGPRVLWGDLHGHSALSDGTGLPEDYFLYARDVAALDVVALTDHDHWGMLPLDNHPQLWEEIHRQTRRFHDPGRFVTLLGYEWTSWIHGHRHVLYFSDEGEVISSLDPATESPLQLWQALEGKPALTFAHHSAGGPIPTNWAIPPDPRFEPVTEIVSVHGSSEAPDSPRPIYNTIPGNFVRDVLDRGYRFGFIGSGDGHDGHPGLTQLGSRQSGLAAILSEERTREGVLAALRARRVYATNGPRILLRTAFGAHRMGSLIELEDDTTLTDELFVHVVSVDPLMRIDLIRSGEVVDSIPTEGRREVRLQRTVADLKRGEYLYVRAVQENEGAAWSSPIYVQ